MKKFYLLVFISLFCLSAASAQSFTKGNLVVFKVGKGSATTDTLTSAGFPVNIDEYTAAGVYVRSLPMPTAVAGSNKRLITSGSANTEGQLTRSADKRFLLVPGYDTIPDPARLSINNAPSAIVNRVIAIIGNDGIVNTSTALTDAYSSNSFRAVASTDGNDLWLAGTAAPATGTAGVRYAVKGSTNSSPVNSFSTVSNIRMVNIFNSQLYITTGSGTYKAIAAVGTGTPKDSAQSVTVLPGMPNLSTATNDPYAFEIKPGSGDIAYVADARSKANGGGVQKWVLSAGNWSLAYTMDSGLTTGLRNLTVDWSTPNPTIYCTTGESYVKNAAGNKIVKVTDTDSTAAFTVLATAAVNYMFRGIALAPEASGNVYTFTGNGNWTIASNWLNNLVPPTPLPSGSSIIIDHTAGGQCVLNTAQTLSAGSTITVNSGKNLVLESSLQIQ